jgi:UDP-2,4-diacetamido-2,4,6-trideoxy-beta-L-altropyranose hydrolase
MRIVFRCDGAKLPEVGTGHVVRMVSLAKKLVQLNLCSNEEILFVIRGAGEYAVGLEILSSTSFLIEKKRDSDLIWNSLAEARVLADLEADILILDRLSTKLRWMQVVKSKNTKVIVFDDNGPGAELAAVTINGILHGKKCWLNCFQGYKYLYLGVPSGIRVPPIANSVSKIVATFGGHDERDLLGFFLNSISDIVNKSKISVEILIREGSENAQIRWQSKIDELLRSGWREIKLTNSAPNFYEKLSAADLVICAGGITVFEAVSLGRPVIGIPQYHHQMETLKKLANIGAIAIGAASMNLDSRYLSDVINDVSCSELMRKKMTSIGAKLIDGKGADRVVSILENVIKEIHPSNATI